MKSIVCGALNEARLSGKFLILAYVIMPDHLHVISDGEKKASVVLRFVNGLITHQNPVRSGLVERAQDYRYSSVRIWNRTPLVDEPLMVDIDKIKWRRGG